MNGFVRNSTAPAFIARTVIGMSPCPVMKMIGMSVRSRDLLLQLEAVEDQEARHRESDNRPRRAGMCEEVLR